MCLHIHLFCLCIKKDSEKGVTFKIFYLPSQPDTHSAHAELKLPLLLINQLFHIKNTIYVPKGTYGDYRFSDFGYFENIVEFDATGIDKTTTSIDVEEVSRYSVNGQRLVGPTKGLNIVKYSDGSVKKVAVE
ncbi:cell surface protein [Prevotella sp. CAG:1092]|nr:cell surface protein [Prevotella sp. CAG:1092]